MPPGWLLAPAVSLAGTSPAAPTLSQTEEQTAAGNKTHEQQIRRFRAEGGAECAGSAPDTRDSAPSRAGFNQESCDHNKHNNSGQEGHKPQKHSPAEEKH